LYHSTATLLPDGRVLVAGSGHNYFNDIAEFNGEIFSPAYLFKGARPTISSSPPMANYGKGFFVGTPDGASIASVSLIRNGAVTHSFNMDQRLVPLSFQQTAGGLTVQAPASANLAPPGTYMLFIVNSNGVPSVAPFVRLPAPYEDSSAPTAPSNLTASGGVGTVSLNWLAASDNVGVTKYDVYRSTTSGFTPTAANRVAQVTSLAYVDAPPAAGTYYYVVTAEDAAGNVGPASNQASAAATADVTPPTAALTNPAGGTTVTGMVGLTANASDDVGVAGVQFLLDGVSLGAEDTAAPYSLAWDSATASNGSHTLSARARDAAGNVTTSSAVTVTVSNAATPAGLVAYYHFDDGAGSTAIDSSGRGNAGTLSNASWSNSGKYGGALSFNGTNSIVNVADSDSLDLSSAMTLEAWVMPTTVTGYRTVMMKEVPGDLSYALYAGDTGGRPNAWGRVGTKSTGVAGASGLPLNAWSHVAATYDGAVIALYVNGTQVASKAMSGALATSASPFHIGGNTVWGEYFAGLIDEVRVYNRPLTGGEIQADMGTGGAIFTAQAAAPIFAPLGAGPDPVLTGTATGTVVRDRAGGSLFSDHQPARSTLPLRRRRPFELSGRE
jgi:hypothetical protein